ncbi:MAG: gliding motility-associated C-terminal domain-containing protein [Flavobacteriales bacterium]|nr:gliding motility-associated C-terminal domain-containing protein [Flavobacteriales bacterium]
MKRFRHLLLLLLSLLPFAGKATHNQAGEIIICQLGGLLYEATIITHTRTSSPADRPEFILDWGDGSPLDTIARDSLVPIPGMDVQRNVYISTHTYVGGAVYTLQYEDPNRVGGVVNIPGSVNIPICVQTTIMVPLDEDEIYGCSPRFLNPPLQEACIFQPWYHNPGAWDPDGDSLSYQLRVCRGAGCEEIDPYFFPDEIAPGPDNEFEMDPITGTISWVSPHFPGMYNFAFMVIEWRDGDPIGFVERDMQVFVNEPCNNQTPEIQEVLDTCVTAGDFLTLNVTATDPDVAQDLDLTALGEPLIVATSPAQFLSPINNNPVSGTFSWATVCAHVRLQPYQMVFNVRDNDADVPLEDYETMFITVVAPAPENPIATPLSDAIQLNWDASICSNATGYTVYRRSGSYGFVPDNCETGVPAYTGYVQISGDCINSTSYLDNDPDLFVGNEYCYMVIACFPDGAESYASIEFCAILEQTVPIITHVSVGQTDITTGIDTVRWSNAWDLDTLQYPGPYFFKLYRGNGFSGANTLIETTASSNNFQHPDTTFIDTNLDTETGPHVYRVELFGNGGNDTIGDSSPATSIFLSIDPNDELLNLSWQSITPWVNTLYEVQRFDGVTFVPIGTTANTNYTDTALVNGTEYCYRIKSTGAYSLPDFQDVLINFSQEACGIPVDLTPPCPPTLALDNDCDVPLNTLTWNNPITSCANSDDCNTYSIYFSPTQDGELQLIATITGCTDTVFEHVIDGSVAGCYAITATDSIGNESAFSNIVCGDNCPYYALPNVFSPNNDGQNDLFVPFPWRGVERIDLQIFNRWGQVVFATEDPAVNWDGLHAEKKEPVPDGVYFITCTVFYQRLTGIVPEQINGYVHVLGGAGAVNGN